MVKINDDLSRKPAEYVQGAVCPSCFRPLPYPHVHPEYSADGHTFRMVQGWCFNCHRGAIIIQFRGMAGKWHIHKFTAYDIADNIPIALDGGQWTVLCDLPPAQQPTPPVVQTGPGGEYIKRITEDDLNKEIYLLAKLAGIMDSCKSILTDLIKKLQTYKTT